jgi:hypothetical protein
MTVTSAGHAHPPAKAAGLNRQTLAALGAAGVDDGTATTGFHADKKAVSACAANFGGLISAFHFGKSDIQIQDSLPLSQIY